MCGVYLFLSVICILFTNSLEYEVPPVLVQAYSPKGLSVSIPDEDGISLFAFHGKINQEMDGREAGTYSVDILKPRDGRWTYTNRAAKLKPGDVIYYWVNVDYDDGEGKRGYIKDDQSFTVTELLDVNALGGLLNTKPSSTTTTTTTRRPTKTTKAPTTKPTCQLSATLFNGKNRCTGDLIFEDNFSGSLSTQKWKNEIKFADDPDYEFVLYQNNRENIYVENNRLYIRPSLTEDKYGVGFVSNQNGLDLGETCTGVLGSLECRQKPKAFLILPPVISSQITTKDSFSFTYGIVEIRARLPKGDWIYPELYLRSKTEPYGPGLSSGLIRIAFLPGNADSSKQLSGGCLLGQTLSARNYAVKTVRSEMNWNDAFHIFKMQWTPDGITLLVDDRVYGNIHPPEGGFFEERATLGLETATVERWKKGSSFAPFDQEMYLQLGVGVGGQCFTDRSDGTKPWSSDDPKAQIYFYRAQSTWSETWSSDSALIVDYVKVWAV
ncbi:hypothetical protein ILUMI_12789 [Ignelater luminosus]|uniref:Uncharacterized protein n=1 Tax=Ignelater luminosus TaxID=2038154 RepID=A0A8K0D249_IGNLU|nr:hypothetical protein ILUMI_12789 [Ignelater luminosus]